jgi:hypothetical protein
MEVKQYNSLIKVFLERFERDFNQFWEYRKIERAFELNRLVSNDPKKIVRYDMPPHPFYGNLFAETVMVNLNAGIPSGKNETKVELKHQGINGFYDFYNFLFNFGEIRYHEGATVDGFDAKQIAFLLKYDEKSRLLDFEDRKEVNKTCSFLPNLRKLLSNRCQLELIPYGSTRFDTKDFRNEVTMEYFRELVDLISSFERKIVFFNGSIFRYLLKRSRDDFNVKISERIGSQLTKKDGTITKGRYYYSYGELTSNSKIIPFVIADTFTQQGLNGDLMRQYGELVTREIFKG